VPQGNLFNGFPIQAAIVLEWDPKTDRWRLSGHTKYSDGEPGNRFSNRLPAGFDDVALGELVADYVVDWMRLTPGYAVSDLQRGAARLKGSSAGIG
jgi:hypothetical protein